MNFPVHSSVNIDSVVPDACSEELCYEPDVKLDAVTTLDLPGSIHDPDTDVMTSKYVRRLPGLSPEGHVQERYNINGIALSAHSKMIKKFWPTLTSAAQHAYPAFAAMYNEIIAKAVPNFIGARIPLTSGLSIDRWRFHLASYHDQTLCEFLEFGWPLGYKAETPPLSVDTNHPSAKAFMSHVNNFLQTELNHQALLGPFKQPPFQPWTRISPLLTRAKKDSSARRIIVDLSFPTGHSVNDGIDPKDHFGNDITYSLPSIIDLINLVQRSGQACYLWKADLTRAYRQLRVDPADSPLLAIKVDSHIYLDRCPPFGCRSSASICQRMANSLVYIMASKGHHVIAYLDDFGGCHDSLIEAQKAYNTFKELAKDLGLQLATNKCCPPNNKMEWLGYHVDTIAMSVTIPQAKLDETLQECKLWLSRAHATKRMIQQIAGKLLFICNCVHQGRKFMARILAALRDIGTRQWITIDKEFKADINWFCKYAEQGNGILLCAPKKQQLYIECDSSLHGAGGNNDEKYYAWAYSKKHKKTFPYIYQLEAINIVVAVKTLANFCPTIPTHLTVWTDNITSSFALQTGRTKDNVLGACARELWLHASKANMTLEIKHKRGELIPLADALSRLSHDQPKKKLALEIVKSKGLKCVSPNLNEYQFFETSL